MFFRLYDSSGDPTDSAFRVISIEDLNNDGFSDVLVNKTEIDGDGLTDNLYVVYGYAGQAGQAGQTGDTIDLASLTETQGLLLTKFNGADNGYIYSAS